MLIKINNNNYFSLLKIKFLQINKHSLSKIINNKFKNKDKQAY